MSPEELAEIVAAVKAELAPPPPAPSLHAIDPTHLQVVTGQVILADHINSLANQSVPKYANQAALTADWAAPALGSLAYLQDINALVVYDAPILGGSNVWHILGGLRMGYAYGGAQNIPTSVGTLVTMSSFGGAANKAGRGTWSTTGEITVPVTGTYLVSGNVTWSQNATGERRLYVEHFFAGAWGFAGVAGGTIEANVAGTSALRQGVTAMVSVNAGEKVGMFAWQSSGVALPLYLGTNNIDAPHLAVHLLGAE